MGYFIEKMQQQVFIIIIVELYKVNCLYCLVIINDGLLYSVGGDMLILMVGFVCGEFNIISWLMFCDYVICFIFVDDCLVVNGMCLLVVLCSGIDEFFVFGEFGVIGIGVFYVLMI